MDSELTPALSAPHRLVMAISVFCVHFFTLFLVILFLCNCVPLFERFVAWEFELSAISKQVFSLSHFTIRYWYLIIAIVMFFDALIVTLCTWSPRSKGLLLLFYTLFWLLAVSIFFVVAGLAICLPLDSFLAGLE